MKRIGSAISESTHAFPRAYVVSPRPTSELLTALAGVLSARGTRWYLFGAQAVIIWGAPRMSADVDVTVEIAPEEARGFALSMEEAGFELRIRNVEEFVERTRVLPFVHPATQIPLDVVFAGPGLEELFLDRARSVELAGINIPVISPEDLVVTKILAGRPKDLADARGVLKEQGVSLDLDQIRGTLDLLERSLDRSDLRPILEDELKQAGTS